MSHSPLFILAISVVGLLALDAAVLWWALRRISTDVRTIECPIMNAPAKVTFTCDPFTGILLGVEKCSLIEHVTCNHACLDPAGCVSLPSASKEPS